ncbi:MAG: ImmA/IrrE family metallo-endopeptidase [Sphingomonadaceae bacterium]
MLIDDDVSRVKDLAEKVLRNSSCSKPPVNVNLIGLFDPGKPVIVHPVPLNGHRGKLLDQGDEWHILVNRNDPQVSQRFTILHEGFHVLRRVRNVALASTGSDLEILADLFAACVLMPEEWVRDRWPKVKELWRLASIFQVSQSAMKVRLQELGLSDNATRGLSLELKAQD